jgi:hypothetical protein
MPIKNNKFNPRKLDRKFIACILFVLIIIVISGYLIVPKQIANMRAKATFNKLYVGSNLLYSKKYASYCEPLLEIGGTAACSSGYDKVYGVNNLRNSIQNLEKLLNSQGFIKNHSQYCQVCSPSFTRGAREAVDVFVLPAGNRNVSVVSAQYGYSIYSYFDESVSNKIVSGQDVVGLSYYYIYKK